MNDDGTFEQHLRREMHAAPGVALHLPSTAQVVRLARRRQLRHRSAVGGLALVAAAGAGVLPTWGFGGGVSTTGGPAAGGPGAGAPVDEVPDTRPAPSETAAPGPTAPTPALTGRATAPAASPTATAAQTPGAGGGTDETPPGAPPTAAAFVTPEPENRSAQSSLGVALEGGVAAVWVETYRGAPDQIALGVIGQQLGVLGIAATDAPAQWWSGTGPDAVTPLAYGVVPAGATDVTVELDDGTTLPVDAVEFPARPGSAAWIAVGPELGTAEAPRTAVAVTWTGDDGVSRTSADGGLVG